MIPNKTRLRFFILLAVALTLSACIEAPHQYSAEATTAKVVDADTKKPIAGVIVTANWQLEQGTVGGNVPVGQIMVMEAVTDKDGKFTFPAWGPKWTFKGHLVIDDPQLLLFKGGYEYRGLQNEVTTRYNKGSLRHSDWNGKTIDLKPLGGADIQIQYKNLLGFSKEVDNFSTWHIDPCQWTNLPLAVNTIRQERKKFEAQGMSSPWDRTFDQRLLDGEQYFFKTCGSAAQKFFKEIKK